MLTTFTILACLLVTSVGGQQTYPILGLTEGQIGNVMDETLRLHDTNYCNWST